jgi:LAO/AO transport system kinase
MTVRLMEAPLLKRLRAGDTKAIARAITIMEAGGNVASGLHRQLLPSTGAAVTVGFTGPPGAGKSTLIDAFVAELRKSGRTVAVAAVDPSSPLSGGAVLGDRIRMGRHTEDPGVFIRSIASRGHLGGLTESIQHIVDVLDVAGRDVIVIETVGAGQSEVEIVEVADIRIVVNAPGLGDDVQANKAGILVIASILVVNKADLPLATRTVRQLRSMLSLRRESDRNVPVIETVASSGQGVAQLLEAVFSLAPQTPVERQARRRARVHRLMAEAAAAEIRRRVSWRGLMKRSRTLLELWRVEFQSKRRRAPTSRRAAKSRSAFQSLQIIGTKRSERVT